MRGSSWATMKPPFSVCGERSRARSSPRIFTGNLIVQLGTVTEHLNRHWYERNSGQVVIDVQRQVFHPVKRWMAATLDGKVEGTGAILEAKFMLPWSFSEEGAAEKHMAQLQHNMWVTASGRAVLSIITGGGKWVEITLPADPLYQHLLLTAEKKFWRCVGTGDPPRLFGIEPPRPRIEAVRIVDMSASNAWAEFANVFLSAAAGPSRTRKVQVRAKRPNAGGCQGGKRPRYPCQALQIRCSQLRSSRHRSKQPCSALAVAIGAIAGALAKAHAEMDNPAKSLTATRCPYPIPARDPTGHSVMPRWQRVWRSFGSVSPNMESR